MKNKKNKLSKEEERIAKSIAMLIATKIIFDALIIPLHKTIFKKKRKEKKK